MFNHIMVGSNDLEKAKTFYDATLGAMGAKPGFTDPLGRIVYFHDGAVFMVTTPLDGQPATVSNGGTIGFKMKSPEEADAWHKAGLETGGITIEDPPGWRDSQIGRMYLAYLRDPDGNKLCGIFMER